MFFLARKIRQWCRWLACFFNKKPQHPTFIQPACPSTQADFPIRELLLTNNQEMIIIMTPNGKFTATTELLSYLTQLASHSRLH